VAVSGGPDSVALLCALVELRDTAGAGPLVIAHLNHRLRGEESDADEAFVRALRASLTAAGHIGLELCCEGIDVAARAEGQNLEEIARQVRYEWLAGVAREYRLELVATGHTADDQAETVLHRLLRGSGLQGLRGIAAQRELESGIAVIRPLLAVSRADVLAYLAERGQVYRTDSSNADPGRTRNRIRHELLPLLAAHYNPGVKHILCRLADQAEELFDSLEPQARRLLSEAELPRAGTLLIFDRARLAAAPRHLVREAFRLAWSREGWPMGRMGYAEWERLAAVASGEAAAAEFPGGVRARGTDRVVQVGSVS
jgi:tRNA(Ile)-lysidine synthase